MCYLVSAADCFACRMSADLLYPSLHQMFVAFQYILAPLKLYCLFTLHVVEWGTRAVEPSKAVAAVQPNSGEKEDIRQWSAHVHDYAPAADSHGVDVTAATVTVHSMPSVL